MNALLALVKEADLDPRMFTRGDVESNIFIEDRYCKHFHELELHKTGIEFTIAADWKDGTRIFSFRSNDCTFDENGPRPRVHANWRSWSTDFADIEKAFKAWLNVSARKYSQYLAEEDEEKSTPDLWAELDVVSADLSQLENTPFTEEEGGRIVITLTDFLNEVERRELLSQDAFRLLRERVEYSIESSKRLSRKDWIMATTGALMGYVAQVGLTAAVANELLRLAADALNWIWHYRPPLPP